MKKMIFLVSLMLSVSLSAESGLDTESKFADTKQDNVVVESTQVESNKIKAIASPTTKACETALQNGTYSEYNTDGTLKSFQIISNADKNCPKNIENGTYSRYYENGRLKSFHIIL